MVGLIVMVATLSALLLLMVGLGILAGKEENGAVGMYVVFAIIVTSIGISAGKCTYNDLIANEKKCAPCRAVCVSSPNNTNVTDASALDAGTVDAALAEAPETK